MLRVLRELLKEGKGGHLVLGNQRTLTGRITMMMTTKGIESRGMVLSLIDLGGLTKIWTQAMKNLWRKTLNLFRGTYLKV